MVKNEISVWPLFMELLFFILFKYFESAKPKFSDTLNVWRIDHMTIKRNVVGVKQKLINQHFMFNINGKKWNFSMTIVYGTIVLYTFQILREC